MVEGKKNIKRVRQQAAMSYDEPKLIIQQSEATLSQEAIAKCYQKKTKFKEWWSNWEKSMVHVL